MVFKLQHRGDNGYTDILCKGRILKDDIRCEVCGTLDELSSFLGLAKSMVKRKAIIDLIEKIQKELLLIGTEVATSRRYIKYLKKRLNKEHLGFIERKIEELQRSFVKDKHSFAIPGKNSLSSVLDVARTVCRRLERRMVTLKRKRGLERSFSLLYINRLSDLLYLLARAAEKRFR